MTYYIVLASRIGEESVAGVDPRYVVGCYGKLSSARARATTERKTGGLTIEIREIHPLEGLLVDATPYDKFQAAEYAIDAAAQRAAALRPVAHAWTNGDMIDRQKIA